MAATMFLIHVAHGICTYFAAPAPKCAGQKPVCTTCLFSSDASSCIRDGYQDDCSAMSDVSLFNTREFYSANFEIH